MEIKKISKENIGKVAFLIKEYKRERGIEISAEKCKQVINEPFKDTRTESFVINEGAKTIGVGVVLMKGDFAEIKEFFVKKEFRKKGYGRELMKHIMNWTRKNNIRIIVAYSLTGYNEFFRKFGFREEAFLKDYFKEGENVVLMTKRLEMEKQASLKTTLETLNIAKETSDILTKLPVR